MLAQAVGAEAFLAEARGERDENGHALVTRDGRARERCVQTVAGALPTRSPREANRRVDEQMRKKV